MKYELTITVQLKSKCSPERVAKQFTSLFEFGTIKDSIADALKLDDDPRLMCVSVKRKNDVPSSRT
jgi:hypothetical protein